MGRKLTKISLFIFYLSFFMSSYDSPIFSKLRYGSIGFIIFVYFIDYLMGKRQIKANKSGTTPVLILNYLLYLVLAVMLFFSQYQGVSIAKYFSLLLLFVLSFTVLPNLINVVGIKTNNRIVILSIALSILIAFGISPHGIATSGGARFGLDARLKLFFDTPNTLGSFCSIGLLLMFYNFYKNNYRLKFRYLIFAGLFIWFLIQSDTRTSMYALIAFVILFIYKNSFTNKYIKPIKYSVAILALSYLGVYVYTHFTYDELNYILSFRLDLFKTALTQLVDNNTVLTGNGSYLNSQLSSLGIQVIDDGYIYMLYQNGLIALFVLISLLITMYYLMNRYIKNKKDKIFMSTYFLIFLFICFFENNLFNLSGMFCILTYSYIYYFIKFGYVEVEEETEAKKKRKFKRIVWA